MDTCKPIATPLATKTDCLASTDTLTNPFLFRSLVGALQYLTSTRPDLTYPINLVSQYMHNPTLSHMSLVKRILRYVQATSHYGLHLLRKNALELYAFSDVDWASCPLTRRSTTSYAIFLGSNLI